MKKRWFIYLGIFIMCLLVITNCGKDDDAFIYQKGYPKEDSPAFKEYMRIESGLAGDATLRHENHKYTVMRGGKDGLHYYQYTDKELQDSYAVIFSSDQMFYSHINNSRFLDAKGPIRYIIGRQLPKLRLDHKNMLQVQTELGEKKIKLPIKATADSEDIYLYLYAIDKKNMLIGVKDYTGDGDTKTYYIFLKQNLLKYQIVNKDELPATIESGKLNDYLSVFPKVAEDGSYLHLFDKYIFEKKTNLVRKISEDDYLSEDGKYVYLNGAEDKDIMSEGVQRIQTVENYLKRNHKDEVQFNLDFEKAFDGAGLKVKKVNSAEITYFNKNYVAIQFSYDFIWYGSGYIDMLIDLQDKKHPTAYLID
ncbi:hypothetical protein MOB25_02045 [Bacillus haynesii]|uniref:hypothetical protein n=1 Tax=Bacillus haynesii TaxID=1925021 RepID=UPI0022810927|nr:hypothetical protein [Bacillus haynesii]MCY7752123.1 hypothetical protein [Bacillus haynesii]